MTRFNLKYIYKATLCHEMSTVKFLYYFFRNRSGDVIALESKLLSDMRMDMCEKGKCYSIIGKMTPLGYIEKYRVYTFIEIRTIDPLGKGTRIFDSFDGIMGTRKQITQRFVELLLY